MKLARSGDIDRSDAGVLPMINVVFLLLVFFMVAGAIRSGTWFDTEPPTTEREDETPRASRIVHLDPSGMLALDGRRVSRSELVLALSAPGGLSDVDRNEALPTLALEADGEVSFRVLRDTMEALQEAGVIDVELITSRVLAVDR